MIITARNGRQIELDDEDAHLLAPYGTWCATNRPGQRTPYAIGRTRGAGKMPYVLMHRVIMGFPASHIDHADGNGLNNHRSNLRLCTRSQNAANSSIVKSLSGFKGVHKSKGRHNFVARVRIDYRTIHLGVFDDAESAARAYDAAAIKYFGEFARLNFPFGGDHAVTE